MSLFKISRGNAANLPEEIRDGESFYAVDINKFYIDHNQIRSCINPDAFGRIKIGNTIISADALPDTLEISGSEYVVVTPDAANDKITISTTGLMPLTGGDFTGPVSLAADPQLSLQAATKQYVDAQIQTVETNIDWKEAVDTYSDIDVVYPFPQDGWTVNVKDTDYTYRYNGSEWVVISANAIPNATESVNGLMTTEHVIKLDGIAPGATDNLGTVTEVRPGVGLAGDVITDTGTIKANMASEVASNYDSNEITDEADRQYAVTPDNSGYLSVNVPWVNTVPQGYCASDADEPAKTAECTDFTLQANTYINVLIKHGNTYEDGITLNINDTGDVDIYIDGEASSATNYNLPSGSYIVFYDGTGFQFRTDGKIPADISGDAATVNNHTVQSDVPADAVFTDTTYTFDTGDNNGQIKVTSEGVSENISVYGLGSAAYTASTAYDSAGTAAAAVAALDGSAGIASVASDVVTIKAGLTETDGIISNSGADDIVLAKVAKTGAAADVSVTDSGYYFSGSTVEAVLAELYEAIQGADASKTVYMVTSDNPGSYAAVYDLYQGANGGGSASDTHIGTINIPKDMVVSSGQVRTVTTADEPYEGAAVGDVYIDLTLANATSDHIYIPANALVEYVTGGTAADGIITVNVDSSTHVATATINDGEVTKAKLVSAVQTSLGYADTSVQDVAEGATNGTIKFKKTGDAAQYTEVAVHGLGSAAYTASTDYATSAQGAAADTAVQSVKIGTDATEYKSGTTVTLPEYYTTTEVDDMFDSFESDIDWKETVATFSDIATTYPNPVNGWTVNTRDDGYTYRYDGTNWIVISANAIPDATTSTDGLMTTTQVTKLNGIEDGATAIAVKGDAETDYRTGNVNITPANLGLGNVDNTADLDKPISTATQTALDDKVDKVTGKQLSTEDYTTAEQTKLAGITAGAEPNQDAFGNVVVGSTTIAADSETDSLTLAAGTNVTLTPDAANKEVTIEATDTTYTFVSGTNQFTVTPDGGTAQTVAVTPSITDNITGSGVSGSIAVFDGTNTIADGPAFGNDTNTFLRNNGTWGSPQGAGTVTSVAAGVGLKTADGSAITGSGTVKAALKSETASSLTAAAVGATADREYAVHPDANGDLAVNVPWEHYDGLIAYCGTAGNVKDKTATCPGYVLRPDSYVVVMIENDNTIWDVGATLSINNTAAKAITVDDIFLVDGGPLPLLAGMYLVYYDGDFYRFRTDGEIEVIDNIVLDDIDDIFGIVRPEPEPDEGEDQSDPVGT